MLNDANETVDYKKWGPSVPRGVLLLVHGLGAHAGRWEAMGSFFANKGIASYAVEFRDLNQPYNKIIDLYNLIVQENPSKNIFLVGESMGSIISLLLLSDSPGLFSGLVCISPAFVSRYRPGLSDSLKILAAIFFNPEKKFNLPFNSSMCTRDVEYIKRLDKDPREYRSISAKRILDILLAQARAKHVKNKIAEPVLFLLAGDDKLVDPQAARQIFNSLTVKDKTLIEFPGMYHSLSIETGKETVFEEISKWVEKRI